MGYQFTETDLAELEKALLAPEAAARFSDGRFVEYLSTDELIKRIAYVREALNAQANLK